MQTNTQKGFAMHCSHIACVAGASLAIAAAASADQTVVFSDGPGDTNGGIFNAQTSDHGNFQTFCLEFREQLDINAGTRYEYVISTETKFNGNGTTDPLDSRSAYLYQEFRNGEIRDLLGDQGLTDTEVANAMQIALWDIESQGVDFSNYPDYQNAQDLIAIAQDAVDSGRWSGLGNVRVMQNWVQGMVDTEEGARQDTLIIIPLPSSVGLAGLGLFGLASFRRRRDGRG